ncbi:MAG: iron-containing alcohol dehydrogenase [Anaerolineae bacterium]|jgi:alcohol dehydrogenase class IV|nr:iron-containing alcohol dehydrogenase [Anaerolineae bacterium]MDH7472680.1 iron-containing alcohol dehydrogenase [Anaerolineae bacterium]
MVFDRARRLIREFKGDTYAFGVGALERSGTLATQLARRAVIVRGTSDASRRVADQVQHSLRVVGVEVIAEIDGARPNAPREDVIRIANQLKGLQTQEAAAVVIGGGSAIDAVKAANVLFTLGGEIDNYFGVGRVGEALAVGERRLLPLLAVQTAASSAAHLTKYSNVTDLARGQKKLIVDEAIIPPRAVFQYDVTVSMLPDFTLDGAFDGIAHCLEVFLGAVGRPEYDRIAEVATTGIRLIVNHVQRAVAVPDDLTAREAMGLGTDLGGYAIMLGGTSGAHLTSFSLVDILPHGRACAIMNPYYVMFYAPAVEIPLRAVGHIYREAGLTDADVDALSGRDLGLAVAEAMVELSRRVGFPTTLSQVPGFTDEHIARALAAAKDPQLRMKLQNMPVPLTAEMVDEYMGSVLLAARDGDLSLVKNVS